MEWTDTEQAKLEELYDRLRQEEDFVIQIARRFPGRTKEAVRSKLKVIRRGRGEPVQAATVPAQVARDRQRKRLESQLSILQRKYRAAIDDANFQEAILKCVEEQIVTLPILKRPRRAKLSTAKVSETAGLLLSCLHIGEVVDEEETAGFGKYDFDLFSARMKLLAKKVINISQNILSGYNLKKLVVGGLGDWVSGTIHDELVETAEGTVIEWTFCGALVMAQFLQELLQYFEEIELICVIGNHGRMTKKPRFKRRYVNWDYVLYNTLALMMKDEPRISFHLPKSFFTVRDIEGWKFLFLHGDNIKAWQGYPFYGVDRAVYKIKELLGSRQEYIDYAVLAHFHQQLSFDRVHGEVFVNGSLKGGDEFALGRLFTSAQPKQLFFGIHKDEGVTWRFPLNPFKADPEQEMYPFSFSEDIAVQTASLIG